MKKSTVILGCLASLFIINIVIAGDFRAYYTKVDSGEEFEKYSRTGDYADIVVEVNGGKFVFGLGSSYLPYWEKDGKKWFVKELVERSGDGDEKRPDKVNTFSRVMLIEKCDEKALVYWRYLPQFTGTNPHFGVDATKFVEEYFTIHKDGTVERQMKKGTPKVDAWRDPKNVMVQTLHLSDEGIKVENVKPASTSIETKKVKGSPVKKSDVAKPAAWWSFDEGHGDTTAEQVSGYSSEIAGHKSLWKQGVSGTALQFDGYNTVIEFPAENGPKPTNAITLEGWIAVGAYPWSWTPIVQQCDDKSEELLAMGGDRSLLPGEEEDGNLESMEFEDLPEVVHEIARREYPDQSLMGVERQRIRGKVYYHVMFEVDGMEAGLKIDSKGNILSRWHPDEEDEGEEKAFNFLLNEEDVGYFLGLDGMGYPGMKTLINGKWVELTSKVHLERRQWYHIIGTYDGESGLMTLYVDGKPAGQKNVGKGNITLSKKNIKIGQGKPRRPIKPVRANTFKGTFSFDGLIDEVKIYNNALTASEVAKLYEEVKPGNSVITKVDMQKRVLPAGQDRGEFGGYYTRLDYYETWDNLWRFGGHPDVVVEFDELPTKFVFWRGVSYIPMLVNDKGQWYTNEFNETWNKTGGQGCQEPMSDKESYTNHAKIIENTDARVVVQWRYPLLDVLHVMANYDDETGWSDWSDWYYYIYPDGVAVKTMHLWTHGQRNHEWQESIAVFGPDQHPEDVIETAPALIMARLDGHVDKYDWVSGPPNRVNYKDTRIHIVNYHSDYDPVTIGTFPDGNIYGGELTDYAVFPTWNHWPVGQMPSDGRYASFPDRTGHSSLTHVFLPTYKEERRGPRPYQEKILMEGMLNLPVEELTELAKSWLQPAELKVVSGAESLGYDQGQRAYVLESKGSDVNVKIEASSESPVYNPAFVIKNWGDSDAAISIDDKAFKSNKTARFGYVDTAEGKNLIAWLKYRSNEPFNVSIQKIE